MPAPLPPIPIDKQSPFLEEQCALCKEPFAPGDEIIICPEDATRHHTHCWAQNGHKCTAYGCQGRGAIADRPPSLTPTEDDSDADEQAVEEDPLAPPVPPGRRGRGGRRVRTLASSQFGCAQSCLLLAIAVAILVMSLSCFGLWALADYLALEVFDIPYRLPLPTLPPPTSPPGLLPTPTPALPTPTLPPSESGFVVGPLLALGVAYWRVGLLSEKA